MYLVKTHNLQGPIADDVALVEDVEHVVIEDAHKEEHILEDALEAEHDEDALKKLHELKNKK
jgi:hypothetical protein